MAGLAILVLAMVAAVGILFALRIEDMSARDTDTEGKDVGCKDGQFERVSTD